MELNPTSAMANEYRTLCDSVLKACNQGNHIRETNSGEENKEENKEENRGDAI